VKAILAAAILGKLKWLSLCNVRRPAAVAAIGSFSGGSWRSSQRRPQPIGLVGCSLAAALGQPWRRRHTPAWLIMLARRRLSMKKLA